MNTVYLKFTNGYNLKGGHNNPVIGHIIKNLVHDITKDTKDTIFSVSSAIYTKEELFDEFKNHGPGKDPAVKLNELEAYLLGKTLHPDEAPGEDPAPGWSMDGQITMDVVKARKIKNDEIDLLTHELIVKGHQWPDEDGEWFSNSDNAQKYWTAKRVLKNGGSTEDLTQYNKDNTVKVPITNANIVSFTDNMDSVIQGHKNSGETFKDQVLAIEGTDIEAMQAIGNIDDTRTV